MIHIYQIPMASQEKDLQAEMDVKWDTRLWNMSSAMQERYYVSNVLQVTTVSKILKYINPQNSI